MRDIEFRAWLKDAKKMAKVLLLNFDKKSAYLETNSLFYSGWGSFEGIELMQFTGLTDKNGKKIFEGDIVKARTSDTPYVIKYQDCGFCCIDGYGITMNMKQYAFDRFECEIIGNVHENAESLEENRDETS